MKGTRVIAKASLWSPQQQKWTVPKKELFAIFVAVELAAKYGWRKTVYLSDSEINVQRIVNRTVSKDLCKLQVKG